MLGFFTNFLCIYGNWYMQRVFYIHVGLHMTWYSIPMFFLFFSFSNFPNLRGGNGHEFVFLRKQASSQCWFFCYKQLYEGKCFGNMICLGYHWLYGIRGNTQIFVIKTNGFHTHERAEHAIKHRPGGFSVWAGAFAVLIF
jgi:hypothetical protein